MMKLIINLVNKWQFSKLRRTAKRRQVLRAQMAEREGKTLHAIEWIDKESAQLPKMYDRKGDLVNHKFRARKFYYTYDVAGANYYLQSMWRSVRFMKIDKS
jgi:hypothetical protein